MCRTQASCLWLIGPELNQTLASTLEVLSSVPLVRQKQRYEKKDLPTRDF